MNTNTETGDAITRAMDWLGQLREEDYAEPAFDGGGEPPSASEPPTAVSRPAVPAARPPVPVTGWPTAVPDASVPEPPLLEPPVLEPPVPEPPVPATRWSAAVRGRHAAVAEPSMPRAEPPVPLAAPLAPVAAPPVPVAEPPVSWAAPPVPVAEPLAPVAEPPVPVAEPPVSWAAPPAPVATPVAVAEPPVTAAGPPLTAPIPAADPGSRGSELTEGPPPAERAPIGEELRIPTAWCEMDSCISHYAHPAALGEVNNRSRAITAGWRIDAFGRLTCPQCQQGPWFWATQQMVPWDRSQAVAMATLMTAVQRAADLGGPASAAEPARLPPVEQALAPLPPYDRG